MSSSAKQARSRRALWVGLLVLSGGLAAWALTRTFEDNLVFFYTPSQFAAGQVPAQRAVRLGGMVQPGSIQRVPGTLEVAFVVTDQTQSVKVRHRGVLPDLFAEGKGVVAQGRLSGEVFEATEILAKHDENYMPPDLSGRKP